VFVLPETGSPSYIRYLLIPGKCSLNHVLVKEEVPCRRCETKGLVCSGPKSSTERNSQVSGEAEEPSQAHIDYFERIKTRKGNDYFLRLVGHTLPADMRLIPTTDFQLPEYVRGIEHSRMSSYFN
jgi:hypothetical protein